MNPFITVKSLSALLATHPNGEALKAVLSKELSRGKEEDLCLPELAEAINAKCNEGAKAYPHGDRTINSVYDLLDIDQKGHIAREDVSAFLSQI